MESANRKKQKLQNSLREMGHLAVAFSGGVDSAFLLAVAHETLGDRVFAVTAESCFFPEREKEEAAAFCMKLGIHQIVCSMDPLQEDTIRQNPPNRCYHCKKKLFSSMMQIASENGAVFLAEGSNMDDLGDYRPGIKAIAELGVRSPLREAGLYKSEIRQLSSEMHLPTWNKPSYACLATRIPYGEILTPDALHMVEQAETVLHQRGFLQVRVRKHGNMARIELPPDDFEQLLAMRNEITDAFRQIGFAYTALDLVGYRTGSMNESLR